MNKEEFQVIDTVCQDLRNKLGPFRTFVDLEKLNDKNHFTGHKLEKVIELSNMSKEQMIKNFSFLLSNIQKLELLIKDYNLGS